MKRTMSMLGSVVLAVSLGCSGEPETEIERGVLDLTMGDTELHGTFEFEGTTITFRAETLASNIWFSTLELNGMTLEATMDMNDGLAIAWDGYTTADGSDTQLLEEDRVAIVMMVKELELQVPDIARIGGVAQSFDNVINKWAEWIPAMALDITEVHEADRGGNLCYYAQNGAGSYTGCDRLERWIVGWHDCWTCSYNNQCSNNVQMGDHCSVSGEDSYIWNGSAWVYGDNDHNTDGAGNRRYVVGNCYGRYGNGCGSGHSYNYSALDHDNCVRNGHWVTSSWCSDELAGAHSDGNCY